MWLRFIFIIYNLKLSSVFPKGATKKDFFLSPLVCLLNNASHMLLECKCVLRYTPSLQMDCLDTSSKGVL